MLAWDGAVVWDGSRFAVAWDANRLRKELECQLEDAALASSLTVKTRESFRGPWHKVDIEILRRMG